MENLGFWNWIFFLKDKYGRMFVEIDCNWRGFGYEVFNLIFVFFEFFKCMLIM